MDQEQRIRSKAKILLEELDTLGFQRNPITDESIDGMARTIASLQKSPVEFRARMAGSMARVMSERASNDERRAYLSEHMETAIRRSLGVPLDFVQKK